MSFVCATARVGARRREAATPRAPSARSRGAGINSVYLLKRSWRPIEFAGRLARRHGACQWGLPRSRDRASTEGIERLQPRRPAMAAELAAQNRGIGHPVELQHPPFATMRLMAVKGGIAAPERDHRSGKRRDLGGTIREIVGAAQQPQPSGFGLPYRVHIEQ